MTMETPMKWLARSAVAPISLIAALGLAACANASSTTTSTNASTKSGAYLCQVLPRVDRLIVTRHAPGSQFRFTFPTVVTVRNASLARGIAASACNLPKLPGGEHCPAGFAVSYHLDFAIRGEKGMGGETIVANPTGCETVVGLGVVRTTALTPSFYRQLGNAMGLKNAGRSRFAGTFQS
jgi:hypothetical protein